MGINAKGNEICYLVLWHTHKDNVHFAHRVPPSETSILSLRWCEVNSFTGISNLAVASGPVAWQCSGWMPLASHSKLLLAQDPRARTCLPGPALCATPAGLACGGAKSALPHQLGDNMHPFSSAFVHSSFIVRYFCATVLYWQIHAQNSKKQGF